MLVHGAAAAILNYQREVVLMRKVEDSGTELFMRGLATAPDRDLAVEMSTDTPAQTTNLKKKSAFLQACDVGSIYCGQRTRDQFKLGKQCLLKRVVLPRVLSPGPFPGPDRHAYQ